MKHRALLCLAGGIFILVALTVLGCASPERVKGVYHRVAPNETLFQIARAYGTTPESIAQANRIDDVNMVKRDQVLFIPGAVGPRDVVARSDEKPPSPAQTPGRALAETPSRTVQPPPVREETLAPASAPATRPPPAPPAPDRTAPPPPTGASSPGFQWPFQGKVTSQFGAQPDGIRANGISLESEKESPVVASRDGAVLHSAPIKFYGETVIIRHDNDYLTIYSHLGSRSVQTGEPVRRGDVIGLPGRNDEKNSYTLYFEMRRNNRPLDPLSQLPKR